MIALPESSSIGNKGIWILSIFYFLTGIFYIVMPFIPVGIPQLPVKALIIPILIVLFMVAARKEHYGVHWLMAVALCFSWAGDVALDIDWQPGIMFMAGLIFFLITHVLYFVVFLRTPGRNLPFNKLFFSIIPLLLYGLLLLFLLYDDLGEMKIPVIVYTTVILAMVAAAINRVGKVNLTSFYLVLTGAVLFLSSDSILALNKFSHPFHSAPPLIMITYVTGQYLIVMGYIRQIRMILIP